MCQWRGPSFLYPHNFASFHVMTFDFLFALLRSKGSGLTVAVLLHWEPPREGDLPVHNYKITWMPRHAHAQHKHTLQANTNTGHGNVHTRSTHSQVRKENNSRVTQGVRKPSVRAFVHNTWIILLYVISIIENRNIFLFIAIAHSGHFIKYT